MVRDCALCYLSPKNKILTYILDSRLGVIGMHWGQLEWLEWFDLDTNRDPSKTKQNGQIGEPKNKNVPRMGFIIGVRS